MYLKTIYFLLTSMAIASHAKVSCPQGLRANGLDMTPTNIVTSKAIFANVTTPVVVFNGLFNLIRLKNLGNGVEAYPNEDVDITFATGGVLCEKIYKFHKVRYLINQDTHARSGSTIDGKGTPLEIEIIYYNIKYGSFENALNHSDGILLITFQILIGPIFNPLFIPFQLGLEAIKKPGSQSFVLSVFAFIWFDVIPLITKYYAFPGSYLDLDSGKSYPAIHILTTPPLASISYNQYKSFTSILSENGKPISTVQPLYPLGSRTVSFAFGYAQVPLLL